MLNFFPKWCGLLLIGLFVVNNAQSEQGEGKSPLSRERDISQRKTVEYWENVFKSHNENEPFRFSLDDKDIEDKRIVEAFLEAIKKNPSNIRSLDFSVVPPYGKPFRSLCKELFKILANNTHIEYLHMYNFSDKMAQEFIELIRKNKTLKNIYLGSECGLYEKDVLKLAKALSENKTLNCLNLENIKNLTLVGKNALRKAEEERKEDNELIIILPTTQDSDLNKNRGYLTTKEEFYLIKP